MRYPIGGLTSHTSPDPEWAPQRIARAKCATQMRSLVVLRPELVTWDHRVLGNAAMRPDFVAHRWDGA